VVRFLVLLAAITSVLLVISMLTRLWRKVTLAVKLIIGVFVLSAISRLWQDTKTIEELLPLLIALAAFGAIWILFWVWGNWNLRERQRRAARGAGGVKEGASEPRKA